MFNPLEPYNDLPPLPPTVSFDLLEIYKELVEANKAVAALRESATALPKAEILLELLSVPEAVASLGIENVHTTVGRVLEARSETLLEKSAEKETLRYADALLYAYGEFKKTGFLGVRNYIEIQHMLEPSKTGIRKTPLDGSRARIENPMSGEVFYTLPEGEGTINKLLRNFEYYFNERPGDWQDIDSLVRASLLHYQFEAIHPFQDGNGRTGRILFVMYLVQQGNLRVPILFLSKYFLKHRPTYNTLLRNVTKENAWKEWVLFALRGITQQANETCQKVQKITELQAELRTYFEKKYPRGHPYGLIENILSYPIITISRIAKDLSISRLTAEKYIKNLELDGIISVFSTKGRERIYAYGALLDVLTS